MANRKQTPSEIETEVLTESARRCCICYGLNFDFTIKKGQIAHLDQNPANSTFDNLAWLCFEHHDEYDSTTRQSKGLTVAEVKDYRGQLYDFISDIRNASNEKIRDSHSFRITYGSDPSNARIRTKDQFILLSTRAGSIEDYMIDLIRGVLADLEKHNSQLSEEMQNYQQLMLRGIWFDDKHGNAVLHIDLLHDRNVKPSMTVMDIEGAFHDGYGWYEGQMITVRAAIIPVYANSDSFFPISHEFYQRNFLW